MENQNHSYFAEISYRGKIEGLLYENELRLTFNNDFI